MFTTTVDLSNTLKKAVIFLYHYVENYDITIIHLLFILCCVADVNGVTLGIV